MASPGRPSSFLSRKRSSCTCFSMLDAVVHQLAEEVVAAEDVAVVARGLAGVGVAVPLQQPLDLAGRAAGGGDDPLAVGLEQLAVHAGLVVVALEAGEAGEPEEVVHPLGVLGQQRHVGVHLTRVVVADAVCPPRVARLRSCRLPGDEVALHADDRLDPVRLGLAPELVGAEDVAVVGHRQRRHPIRADSSNRSSSRAAPSSIENSVCVCRWTKLSADRGRCHGGSSAPSSRVPGQAGRVLGDGSDARGRPPD